MEQVVFTQVPIADLQGYIAHAVKEQFDAIRKAEPQQAQDELLTRKEAARYLRLSLVTLNEYTRHGKVRSHRIGARVLYRRSDLDSCLSAIVNPKRPAA
jgi:excisionase family DNA binding protein